MPSKDPILRFADILENIILIEEFTRGMDLNAYQEDLKTRNATERCMERIRRSTGSVKPRKNNGAVGSARRATICRPFVGSQLCHCGFSSDLTIS